MARDDSECGCSKGFCGVDVIHLFDLEDLCADDARHVDPADEGDREKDRFESGSHEGGEEDDEEEGGDCVEDVADAHEEFVEPAADVGGEGAPEDADEAVEEGGSKSQG